jgi:methionyl-tRNA formyltransferase
VRLVLCGKNTAACRALELALERGDEVWAVGTAGDEGRDGWQRSFRATAAKHGVRFDQPRRINAPDFVAALAAFGADALVSIQYDQILKGPLFERIGCPCLNLHFALLPRHRGVHPIAWAILSGDREAGVTLHHMLEDIDAGDVLAQRRVAIAPDGTARELYDALSEACALLFAESHPFPAELLRRRLPQDPARASYHRAGELDFSQRRVDWSRPAPELQAWLRAWIFPPLQHPETHWRGETLRIERVGAWTGAPRDGAEPGGVLACDAGGIEVAAGGGTLRLRALCDARGESVLGRIAPGERLE